MSKAEAQALIVQEHYNPYRAALLPLAAKQAAAPALGLQLKSLNASTSGEINAAFAELARDRADALFVAGDSFFFVRRAQMVNLASRYGSSRHIHRASIQKPVG